MSTRIALTVNGRTVRAAAETPLLKLLLAEGFAVPHLCWLESLTPYAACRLCLVEVSRGGGAPQVATSCNYPAAEGLAVRLDTEEVRLQRACVFEVLLAQAPGSARLRDAAARWGVDASAFRQQEGECILCGLCERVCRETIGASAIGFAGRGANKELATPYGEASDACIGCGACARVCPTGCIRIEDDGCDRRIPFIRARHELVPCGACGAPTATRAHARWLAARTPGLREEDAVVCDRCKVRATARGYERIV
jgi:NADH dehydrogenase/NADH:ubiquinone oxidoreductase subunit G